MGRCHRNVVQAHTHRRADRPAGYRLLQLSLAGAAIAGAWFGCGSLAAAAPAPAAWRVDAGAPSYAGTGISSTLPRGSPSRAAGTVVVRRAFGPSISSP